MSLASLTSFRSNAIGAASRFPSFVAASAILAGSALWSPPVIAKDDIPEACAGKGSLSQQYQCGTDYYKKQRAEADKQTAITLALQACMNYIKQGTGTKFTTEEVLAAANGKLNRENVCGVARKFGYEKSAKLNLE